MNDGFQNIMVPVYPSINVESAIKRAVDMCDSEGAAIHVVNVQNNFLSTTDHLFHYTANSTKKLVEQWIHKYQSEQYLNIKVDYAKASSIRDAIISKAMNEQVDLIVVGASAGSWWIPWSNDVYNDLAELTGSCVLKVGKDSKEETAVVVTFNEAFNDSTVQNICMMNRKHAIEVHLLQYLTNNKKADEPFSIDLLKAYQSIKAFKCPVAYRLLNGKSRRKAVDRYVHHLQHDVLFVGTDASN